MIRTLEEWREYADRNILASAQTIRNILEDWGEQKKLFLYLDKHWGEEEEYWNQYKKDTVEKSHAIEKAVFEFFCEVTHGNLTYVDTLSSIAWLHWDHKVWCKHSLTELCEKVQLLEEENRKLRGEETPYWKEGEKAP